MGGGVQLTDCVGPYNHPPVVFANTQVPCALLFKEIGEALRVSQHFDGFDGAQHFGGEIDAILSCFLIDSLASDQDLSDEPA